MSVTGGALGVVTGCVCGTWAPRTAILPTLVPFLIFSGYVIPSPTSPSISAGSTTRPSSSTRSACSSSSRSPAASSPRTATACSSRRRSTARSTTTCTTMATPTSRCPMCLWQNCTGEDYLRGAALWLPHYGGVPGYFVILAATRSSHNSSRSSCCLEVLADGTSTRKERELASREGGDERIMRDPPGACLCYSVFFVTPPTTAHSNTVLLVTEPEPGSMVLPLAADKVVFKGKPKRVGQTRARLPRLLVGFVFDQQVTLSMGSL